MKLSKREKDEAKLAQLNKEIAELKEQETSYKAKWQSEKELVNKIQQNKKEIEQLKFEADKLNAKATTVKLLKSVMVSCRAWKMK